MADTLGMRRRLVVPAVLLLVAVACGGEEREVLTTAAPVPSDLPEATLSATAAPRTTSTARASRSQATIGLRTPTPGPAASPKATPETLVGASVAGCPLFPSDNAWRRDVSSDPIDERSADYVNSIGARANVHPD